MLVAALSQCQASHPLEVNVSGVGHIGTVSVSGNVKLPTL